MAKPKPGLDAVAKPKPGLLGSVGSSVLTASALPKANDSLAVAAVTAVGLNGLAVPPPVGASAGGFRGSALPLEKKCIKLMLKKT